MFKRRVFSGVQPSGRIHLGNYLGAIKQWVALQDRFEALYCVVDLHAITAPQDPETLRKKTKEAVKMYLALGVDPRRAHIFVQSQVPQHAELGWILNSAVAKVGDLTKMTQLKDKAGLFDDELILDSFEEFSQTESSQEVKEAIEKMSSLESAKTAKFLAAQTILKFLKERYINPLNISGVGLFDYPVLMAADILLYETDVVPVGDDQEQHVELARTLVRRFNKRFGNTFVVPRARVLHAGARIMGLDDPTKKMSKSAKSENNFIALDDSPELARKKIMRAVTDSEGTIAYDENRPGIKNLVTIYALLQNMMPEAVVSRYAGKGYAEFKKDLAESVAKFLTDFQEKYANIPDWKVQWVLARGRRHATKLAEKKMREVRQKIGFLA